jgi:hypothetical protein
MKNGWSIILLFSAINVWGQNAKPITVIDFVKIKDNKQAETLFYYEKNWKTYRDVAVKKKYIKSYQLLTVKADTTHGFDLILMTEYADSAQFKLAEERFDKIIKEVNPAGPRLLNTLKPSDFRTILFFKQTESLYSSKQNK